MKKLLLACFVMIACALVLPACAYSAELPEIADWQNGKLRITNLETVSGNRGSWQEREYRTDLGARVYAIWIEGAGEKGWNAPSGDIFANDGLIGNGATYKTVTIASEKGLLERHPTTGYSLAVKIDKMGTLTVESQYAEEYEILSAAETLVNEMTANAR